MRVRSGISSYFAVGIQPYLGEVVALSETSEFLLAVILLHSSKRRMVEKGNVLMLNDLLLFMICFQEY